MDSAAQQAAAQETITDQRIGALDLAVQARRVQ